MLYFRRLSLVPSLLICCLIAASQPGSQPNPQAGAAAPTTAWLGGRFIVDVPNVVRRSNILLGHPNMQSTESLGLGNGTLGAAIWAEKGLTAQLNRVDAFPDRKSPGRLVIPGLLRLAQAPDYAAHLDLYDAVLTETGGGMTARIYVRSDSDELVVDITGADPDIAQEARVVLGQDRHPQAVAIGSFGVFTESWADNTAPGASGQRFGTVAAIASSGRAVTASVVDPHTVEIKFKPQTDGSFRVIVAAPQWTELDPYGTNALAAVPTDLVRESRVMESSHEAWWHDFWNRVGLIRLSSSDGAADYMENLRTIYLYTSAAESRGVLPGSNGGVADLFSFSQNDDHDWFPAGYWVWNLRMQQAANASAGAFDLNVPLYSLYRRNLVTLDTWTARHMPGRDGICVPETMRFNGNGYYTGGIATTNASCDSTIAAQWNSRTVTSGAEVAMWVWRQYLMTDDRMFLANQYPIMSGAARFLLSHAAPGTDGMLHTRSNAHETQWDVVDPVTDVAAMQVLFPAVIEAATMLHVDADLAARLRDAIPQLRPLPRTDATSQTQVLSPDADASADTIIAPSAEPYATRHNAENLGLEAVWPHSLIGDDGPLTELARRTYQRRGSVAEPDWSFDALHAARLGLRDEVGKSLLAVTKSYQVYPSGLASWKGQTGQEPYVEQSGVLAAALAEALAQDYDGLLRVAPAVPAGWDADGTVYLQHRSVVHVQVRNGVPVTVVVEVGANHDLRVRNPWPGQSVTMLDNNGMTVVDPTTAGVLTVPAREGQFYVIQLLSQPLNTLPFAPVTGAEATAARHLGPVQIGLDAAPRQ